MAQKIEPNHYHSSFQKRIFDLTLSTIGLVALFPILFVFAAMIKLTSQGPVFFIQKRVSKKGKVFKIIMFRTMYVGAERDQNKFAHLNEAYGPAFKIRDDPRFVGFGKFLAITGLDELPQLINVIKGEMSLVGPRPLPVPEAKKLNKTQKVRELVKPGITSSWVVSGAHNLQFDDWMRLDKEYIRNGSLLTDLSIFLRTAILILKSIPKYAKNIITS